MSHIRTQIKNAVAQILATTPTAWSSVMKSRISTKRQEKWPYLMVFTTNEADEVISVNDPAVYLRTISLAVIGMLKMPGTGDTVTIEDKMDALALEVETKLTNATLKALVNKVQSLSLVSTTLEVVVSENAAGDETVDHAEVVMSFEIVGATSEDNPSVLI